MDKQLFIVGYMGAGKTSLAQTLSQQWNVPCWDSDALLEQRFGLPADEQVASDEKLFRNRESRLLEQLATIQWGVASLGGGIIEEQENRKLLKKLPVFFLDTDVDTCWQRVKEENRQRPLAVNYDSFCFIYQRRRELYLECSRWSVLGTYAYQDILRLLEDQAKAL